MPEVSKKVKGIVGSPVRRIAYLLERAAANRDIISFGGGAPSLPPPSEVLHYLIKKLQKEPQKTVAYTSTVGIPKTLELIAEVLKYEENVDVNPDKQIAITDGGSEGLFIAMNALVNPGEEVIISSPTYLSYIPSIEFVGAKPVEVPAYWHEDFQLYPDRVNEKITKKTKMIILLSPDNPTGRVLDSKNVKGLVEIAEDNDIWLLTDDIYKHMFYEGKFMNSRKFGGNDNTVTCCSFSKSASIPGFRLGYAYGPEKVIERFDKVKQFTSLCPSRPGQVLVQKFLENKGKIQREYVKKTVVPTYRKRRDFMAKSFKKYLPHIGYSMPKGAFYFFVDMSEDLRGMRMDDEKFADRLLSDKNVVLIPGRYFGTEGKNHLRFTFVSETEKRIDEGMKRIADFLR